ncbi:MAG: UbiH/UbiF family hydroxylase [Methylophilales bacterium]|nr:UbiH/UbiF family hydroxylase [Methylophilales bacterium]
MNTDVIVIGGGLVGASTALALSRGGLSVVLVEAGLPQENNTEWDSRIYAITPGNVEFLRDLGVWNTMDASRINPIHAMQVWGDVSNSPLNFDAYSAGVAELGFILENRLMHAALWKALEHTQDLQILCPARCSALEFGKDTAHLTLEDGRNVSAKLIIAADGANSWVRKQAGVEVVAEPYHQLGVVANFDAEKPHGNIARQWFKDDGILAWLPLPGNRISMVWSAFEAQAKTLMELTPEQLCHTVAEAGHHSLGAMHLITPAAAFPLVLQRNQSMIAPRLAMVGDAAHQVHPLAGQGMNLGLRDVQMLVEVLLKTQRDVGDWAILRRYERSRKADVFAMGSVTDGLQKLFNNDDPMLGFLRNTGLRMVNHLPPVKRALMARALA